MKVISIKCPILCHSPTGNECREGENLFDHPWLLAYSTVIDTCNRTREGEIVLLLPLTLFIWKEQLFQLLHIVFGLHQRLSSKESTYNAGDACSLPVLGRSLEKKMATHSSILVWEMPWTEEPDRLQSIGSQKNQTRLSDSKTTTMLSL